MEIVAKFLEVPSIGSTSAGGGQGGGKASAHLDKGNGQCCLLHIKLKNDTGQDK